ncbi:MAG: ankyrin repeat domain-containing protein [Methylococcales bacterium]|nr:ankyrin repeat domain-containing protein [Methylococcales bacterium]
MKYPLFEPLGDDYPIALEQRYERILKKIAELWDEPEIDDYFTSLIIDTRNGRSGFESDVFNEIHQLRKFREFERLRKVEDKYEAVCELKKRGIEFTVEAFLQTVYDGDQSLVDLFVRGGINIHVPDELGNPAIIIALKKGYIVIANILLIAGADPDAYDGHGFTPLLLACGKDTTGYKKIAEKLIRLGADVNARDPLGWTPLLLALSTGAVEVIELLLEHGSNPSVRTRKGENAMSLAQKFGRVELINLLFKEKKYSK